MSGAIQIANDGKCASAVKRLQGFLKLTQANTNTQLVTDTSLYFQKLWIYPGPSATAGKVNANVGAVYVGDQARQFASVSITSVAIQNAAAEQIKNLVTVVAAAHGFSTGDTVTIAGCGDNAFNGKFAVTVVDANTFTYSILDVPATNAPALTSATASGLQAVPAANVVTPDQLNPTDLPLKYELPLGQKQQLSTVVVQGAINDGVFWRAWT